MARSSGSVRFGLQTRVLFLLLGLSLPVLFVVGLLSLRAIAQARDAAVRQSELTLLTQTQQSLKSRVIDKAEIYDRTLFDVQRQLQTVLVVAEQAFSTSRADLPDPRIEMYWQVGSGAVANAPDNLKATVAQAQMVASALKGQVASNKLISLAYFATTDGVMVLNDSSVVPKLPDGFDPRIREWYIAAVDADQAVWTGTYVDAVTGRLTISASTPVKIGGRLIGVIGMDTYLTTIQSDVLELNRSSGGYSFIMESSGDIIVQPELEAGNTQWNEQFTSKNFYASIDPNIQQQFVADVVQKKSGILRLTLENGDSYVAYAPMRTTDWVVGLVIPIDQVVSPAVAAGNAIQAEQNQLRSNLITVMLVTSGLLILVAMSLARTMIRPLRQLDEGARRIAFGQLDQQLVVRRDDELGRLGTSFNLMTMALRQKVEELESNAQHMAAINEASNALKRLRSLSAVLENIPSFLCRHLGFDRAVLYLVRDEYIEVVSVYFGKGNEDIEKEYIDIAHANPIPVDGTSLEASVIRSRQAVIVDNPWEHPQVIKNKQQVSQSDSYAQAPIIGRQNVLGLISADYYLQGRKIDVQDAALLLTFADMVGLTIENAFSFQNLEDLVEQRTSELREALDQAQAADRLKSQFLASVSHELRTPLNAIIGFSTILLDELSPVLMEEQLVDLQTINNNGQYLLDLINDILDMARIEAGKITLNRDPTNLHDLVQSAVDLLRGLNKKPIQLRVDVSPDLPLVDADAIRLRQIMINLLANALKFTEQGFIVVRAVRRIVHQPTIIGNHQLPIGDWVVISIQDTGIGMTPEAVSGLFQEFRQVHAKARGLLGSGLGLSISRRLVQLHDGEIWVESKQGVGSTFSFNLPTAQLLETTQHTVTKPKQQRVSST